MAYPSYEVTIAGLNPLAGIPRPNLPPNVSYRVGSDPAIRLLKYERPPQGWWGSEQLYRTDYSDCRYWYAPEIVEQRAVWEALGPTRIEFEIYTGIELRMEDMRCLSAGYQASYDEIALRFNSWCCNNLGMDHDWTHGGKVSKKLFRLERWYGTIIDYRFAPNWPQHQRHKVKTGYQKIVQNPDVGACQQCVDHDHLCHGHKENLHYVCTPCMWYSREDVCSKKNGI